MYLDGIFEYHTDGTDQQNTLHIMDNRSRIATKRIGDDFGDTTPAVKYNLEDFIGSSVMQLAANGSDVNKEEYYPFGETSFGSYAKKRYKYCGKERDEESGLYYYGARYYSAWTCHFISIDPKATQFSNQSPYNYCFNNPINLVDPYGMEPEGSNDPPKKANPPTNATKFTPAPSDPNIKTDNLRAAGTNGGAGATQLQNLGVKHESTEADVVGKQYPKGTFMSKAADPTPRAAANNNTTGFAGDASNPAPTDQQLLEKAAEMLPSFPELQVGKGSISASTSGEVSVGYKNDKDADSNISVNVFTGENGKVGGTVGAKGSTKGKGVLISDESIEIGPYVVSNSTNSTSETNIQYDATLSPTATVETGYIIQERTAQFVGGVSQTKITVVESRTLSTGQVVPTRTVGVVDQKFIIVGGSVAQVFKIQAKIPAN